MGAMASVLVACGSVGGGDAEFWRPAQGLTTAVYGASGGAGGIVQTGSGGGQVGGFGGSLNSGGAQSFGGIEGQGGLFGTGGTQVFGTGGDLGAGGAAGGGAGGFGAGGSFGTGGTVDTGGTVGTGGTNSGNCNFRFDVTTKSYGGRFKPRNVGAIYIEDASGGFVKTLNVWGTIELGMLTDWQQLSAGNKTDAVSGATRGTDGPVSGSWNCTDVNHQPVPNG